MYLGGGGTKTGGEDGMYEFNVVELPSLPPDDCLVDILTWGLDFCSHVSNGGDGVSSGVGNRFWAFEGTSRSSLTSADAVESGDRFLRRGVAASRTSSGMLEKESPSLASCWTERRPLCLGGSTVDFSGGPAGLLR